MCLVSSDLWYRWSSNPASAKPLVHAFVTSGLDGMNSLLFKLPDYLTNRLQVIQNNAARLIWKQKKSCHIAPHLKAMHWLPVKSRIEYRILMLVYKCLHGEGPKYLVLLLKQYRPTRQLRSSDKLRSQKQSGCTEIGPSL